MSTLTGANSSLAIAVTNLFPAAQTIQGFATDDTFAMDSVDMAETMIGVDGKLSAGFVFNAAKMTIMLMPTSPSLAIFEAWALAQRGTQEVYAANGTIMIPAINRKYVLVNGYLTSSKPFPDVKKLLQPLPFVITWEKIIPSPV